MAGAHAHSHVVITSLFAADGDAAPVTAAPKAKARTLSRRATYTRVDAPAPLLQQQHAAACAPSSSAVERKASNVTVYHDAEEHAEQDAVAAAHASLPACDEDAAERERFYAARLLQWAHDAALAEAEEAQAGPLQQARKSWWRRCFCGGGAV
jgi:hypothetical protein